jgi:hypothetical protein
MTALKLIERARSFEREYPAETQFVSGLIASIERIAAEFEGEQRAELLGKAEETLARQVRSAGNTVSVAIALEQLRRNEEELAVSLRRLVEAHIKRPAAVTLH